MNLFETCFPIISLRELKEDLTEVRVANTVYVIAKHKDGYYAYPERCPHRGTKLIHGKVRQDSVRCPYHGWDLKKNGEVYNPSWPEYKCKARVVKLTEAFKALWMNKNNLSIPVESPEDLDFCGSQSFKLSAPFHVVLDNFNEGSHTAFVHNVLGAVPENAHKINFEWEDKEDHVFIKYFGPQRPNIFFNGPFWKTYLNWDIVWRTYFDPVRMVYDSQWVSQKSGKRWWAKNRSIYFIIPADDETTWLHAFSFTEIMPLFRPFAKLIKKIALILTRNQVMEDEEFYPKIKDLPVSFQGLRLDKFDHPVVAVRKRVDPSYFTSCHK